MDNPTDKYDLHFYQLVISLHAGAMQQMGKVANPFTGKVERDLGMAQNSIDMLDMLRRKSQGNRTDEEDKLIERVLYELRMNFVDESKKGQSADGESDTGTDSPEPEETEAAAPEDDSAGTAGDKDPGGSGEKA